MPKKKSPRLSSSRPLTAAQQKKQIARLDRELVRLLNERATATQRLRQLCQAPQPGDTTSENTASENTSQNRASDNTALAVPDFVNDQQCLADVVQANKGPLQEQAIRGVFRELLSGTRVLLRGLQVAYLGPEFSYSHLAAVEQFGTSAELIPVATIAGVFDALNRHQADFGLVPIENSTDGRVADTLDMFARLPVQICGEVQLRIHHYLLGKCRRSEVREVYSKPQALSQCRTWLACHLPDARTVEMASTTAAARLALEKPRTAAIASRQAGINYGLDFLAEKIEDNRHNVTRFAVIGDSSPKRTGNDKTSLMFELPHQPGALADAMSIFKRNRLNLTWIESFPMVGTPNEYLFFVEFQGHPEDARAKRALGALAKKTVRLEILGSYPATEPVA